MGPYSHISTFKGSATQHALREIPKSIMSIFYYVLRKVPLADACQGKYYA